LRDQAATPPQSWRILPRRQRIGLAAQPDIRPDGRHIRLVIRAVTDVKIAATVRGLASVGGVGSWLFLGADFCWAARAKSAAKWLSEAV
jgi:hypothetical protein